MSFLITLVKTERRKKVFFYKFRKNSLFWWVLCLINWITRTNFDRFLFDNHCTVSVRFKAQEGLSKTDRTEESFSINSKKKFKQNSTLSNGSRLFRNLLACRSIVNWKTQFFYKYNIAKKENIGLFVNYFNVFEVNKFLLLLLGWRWLGKSDSKWIFGSSWIVKVTFWSF